MYRLHNLGIEAKIDWLVVNGYLSRKKIIICPYGNYGMQIKQYINQRYSIQEYAIVDNELWQYNPNVRPMEYLREIAKGDNYAILTGNERVDLLLKEFNSMGIDERKCYLLKGEPLTAQDALLKVAHDDTIDTVLDVGCGKGNHAKILNAFGKNVTGIDSGFTCEVREQKEFKIIEDDFLNHNFEETYDCVWCAHVLEHQLAVEPFLRKLFDCCKEGVGKVAITVPPDRGAVIEGHVTLWNAGLLMYNIIQAGYSCKHAAVKTYAENVSVIVPKEVIPREEDYRMASDSRQYFPENLDCGRTRFGGICFDGNISELNW